jgi:cellulose biosynthesis protein BcsQ
MIFTFYSFKGGVGRSMALANVAELFYARGLSVLMIDFDLEAPGLERYFDVKNTVTPGSEIPGRAGVIDFILSFLELQSFAPKMPPMAPAEIEGDPLFPFSVEPIENFIVPIYDEPSSPGRLSLMPSGNRSKPDFAAYAKRVLGFDWEKFYTEKDGEEFFEWFRTRLRRDWDVVLIDSRTGVTEVGGVCTHHLADAVISFVATNLQNLDGSTMMARSLANPKLIDEGRKGRSLKQLFVPSRVDPQEEDKHDEFASTFNKEFGKYYPKDQSPERSWFLDLRLSYSSAYSYMERVAVRETERASKAELIQAYGRLAARMAITAGPGALSEAWAFSRILSNLPPRSLSFSGREDEMKRIGALMPTGTPVAICGLGGIGKTALAVEYAYRHRAEYTATFFCPAGSEDDMRRGCQEIMRVLSTPITNNPVQEAVCAWLEAHEKWLLILDNAVDPSLTRLIVPQSLRGHVLYTTRSQQVSALGAQTVPIETMSRQASISLFEKRLAKREWNDAEQASAAELVDELGALPLALEQAAAYIVNHNTRIQDYLASYRKRGLGLLDQQTATIAGREVSLSAVLEPMLAETERNPASADVLRVASFLAPDPIPTFLLVAGAKKLGESIEVALASAKDDPLAIDGVLDPLTRYSLIDRNRESQSLSVHKLVADLVRSRTTNPETWLRRTLDALDETFPNPTWENTAVCAALVPHVIAVVAGSSHFPLLLRAAQFLLYRGEYALAEQLLVQASSLGETLDGVVWSQLMAQIKFAQGRIDNAISILEPALKIARRLDLEGPIRSQLSASLAQCFFAIGESAQADRIWIEVLTESKRTTDTRNMVLALGGRAGILVESNPEEAIHHARKAVSYAEPVGADLLAIAYGDLSTVLIKAGQALNPNTLECSQKAIAAAERAYGAEHPILASALRTYAIVLHANGRGTEGDDAFRKAMDIIEASLGAHSSAAAGFRSEYETLLAFVNPSNAAHMAPEQPIKESDSRANENEPATSIAATELETDHTQRTVKASRKWVKYMAALIGVLISVAIWHLATKPPATAPTTPVKPPDTSQVKPLPAPVPPTPAAWGVNVSRDTILEPKPEGGPSAEWEPVRAHEQNYPSAAIFHKGLFYVTIIGEPDAKSATSLAAALNKKTPYTDWNQIRAIHVSNWCPKPLFSRTLKMEDVPMNLYECDSGKK